MSSSNAMCLDKDPTEDISALPAPYEGESCFQVQQYDGSWSPCRIPCGSIGQPYDSSSSRDDLFTSPKDTDPDSISPEPVSSISSIERQDIEPVCAIIQNSKSCADSSIAE